MATLIAESSKFSGSVSVQGTEIRFRAFGRKNWFRLTGVSQKGNMWILKFGRYGRFEIKKRVVKTLDEAIASLVLAAQRLQMSEKAEREARAYAAKLAAQDKKRGARRKPEAADALFKARVQMHLQAAA